MDLIEYESFVRGRRKYPNRENEGLVYTTLALCNEAGEAAGEVKKMWYKGHFTEEGKRKLILELGDSLWYLTAAAQELNMGLGDIMRENMTKLLMRDAT